jgi:serine/threonine protein kinase
VTDAVHPEVAMIGELIGSYRVTAALGEGGMGEVFLAEHPALGRPAAVKMLKLEVSADSTALGRFFNEARAATLIKHPGIVAIFDFGTHTSGRAYLIMEYLDGETMSAMLRREPRLPVERLAAIGRQIASALAAAHAAGIVHRDLKPSNLMIVQDPDMPFAQRVKVLDFGIAKLSTDLTRPIGPAATAPGKLLGTPAYMAPEQCRAAAPVDARADVYALGCILFEAATGEPPFGKRRPPAELLASHMHQPPPRLAGLRPDLPAELTQLVDRCLAKAPEARPQAMHEIVTVLARLGGTPSYPQLPVLKTNDPAPLDRTMTSSIAVDDKRARWPNFLRWRKRR